MSGQGEDQQSSDIPLSKMIQALRTELERAREQAGKEVIRFETEKVELELNVALSTTTKGGGGVEFWVVKAGGEREKSGVTTHTFKLTLIPVTGDARKRVDVAAETEKPAARE